ncbi:YtxH domain-containing protein [Nonomuraea sp. NN258]|uniref:YtxH domain-containing protein n=1 Tax=Nonomuraea antri TaxID=2730852 RepID=UPI0015693720|nr:YtxH domain-containing protein [Nonomuraea antri]NRQ32869.1 YtxH domain-containing protein [Nonomuraea antri]
MRYRMTFAVGMAVGYVLGSRAGRERYEQIKRMAQRVADNPRVQETAGVVGAQASRFAGMARSRMGDTLQQRIPFLGGNDRHADTGVGWPDDDLAEKKARETGIPY